MKNNKRRVWFIPVLIIVLLAIGVSAGLIFSRFILVNGKLIPVDADNIELSGHHVNVAALLRLSSPEYMDLEGCAITAEEYASLKEKFPNCIIKWSVPLSSGYVSNNSTELTLESVDESDLPLFAAFNDLETVHAEGVSEWEILSELEEQYQDIDFSWGVTVNGKYYSSDLTELEFEEPVSFSELNEKLQFFTKLKSVSLAEDDGLSTDEKVALAVAYPAVSFFVNVSEFGKNFPNTVSSLDLSHTDGIDLERLVSLAPLFSDLKTIDFTGCSYSNSEMLRVADAFPNTDVCWQLDIYGKEVSSLDEEIDFSGIQIDDTSEIENALPFLKKLQKVIMSDCGIGDEEMDELNNRYDDVRFVWTVYLGNPRWGSPQYSLRTDTTYFISSLQIGEGNAYKLFDDSAEPLKYCTDMIALDLGHNKITQCDFCRYMPHLRFFIAAGSPVEDISALAECKELYYLELMFCPVTDLSPLLECKELRHLNVCACPTQDSVRPVLSRMTWLERCYMAGKTCCYKSDYDYVYSDEFLPNTEKWLGIDMGFYHAWRTHPSYFEMRDALGGAYYMAKRPDGI